MILGPVEKIPVGQGFCFVIDHKIDDKEKTEIAILRPRSGGLFAVSNRCPHRQGPLCEGVVDDRQVICPYHGHKFDIRTGEGSENGERVKVFQVREENGKVILKINENIKDQ